MEKVDTSGVMSMVGRLQDLACCVMLYGELLYPTAHYARVHVSGTHRSIYTDTRIKSVGISTGNF